MPYTDKYESQGTGYGDRYSSRGSVFSGKYESRYGFLLQENTFFLLLEDGGKIVREEQLDYQNKYGG